MNKLLSASTCMLICAQLDLPQRRTIINLVPADLPKEDGQFDLAIALGTLAASGQIEAQSLDRFEFLGELGLTGELRGVDGVLTAAIAAARDGRSLMVAAAKSEEAAVRRTPPAEKHLIHLVSKLLHCPRLPKSSSALRRTFGTAIKIGDHYQSIALRLFAEPSLRIPDAADERSP